MTDLVRVGENDLELTVVKWSDATYIEDQDQWWHGGITRSVYLYATGPVYLAAVGVTAGLADDFQTGHLRVVVDVAPATALQVTSNVPDQSPILTRPLADAAGGTAHSVKVFADTNDVEWRTIRAWVRAGVVR